jgi:DNA-binding protein HU-beta
VNALTEVVKETLQRGGDVAITGFGKFSVAERGARQGVNPQTGERIQIAASKAPKFSAGADFKKALKGS